MSNKCDGSGMMSLHHAVNYVADGNEIKKKFIYYKYHLCVAQTSAIHQTVLTCCI